jgi:hypothetical protein
MHLSVVEPRSPIQPAAQSLYLLSYSDGLSFEYTSINLAKLYHFFEQIFFESVHRGFVRLQ